MKNDVPNLGELTNKIYGLLHDLLPEDRLKVMNSVAQLFGESPSTGSAAPVQRSSASGTSATAHAAEGGVTPQKYFADKSPQNKGEMLAVAAKYREDQANAHSHVQDDFAKFFTDARQNFDRNNFLRDMKNAQHQAKLFNVGTPKGQYRLSYYGQQYVDALPNRDALKTIHKPKGASRKAKAKKVASKNKA